jgi:hypothetical protein
VKPTVRAEWVTAADPRAESPVNALLFPAKAQEAVEPETPAAQQTAKRKNLAAVVATRLTLPRKKPRRNGKLRLNFRVLWRGV